MRKISKEVMNAVREGRNMSKQNTCVSTTDNITEVRLHGNLIFRLDRSNGSWTAYNGGWNTNTTRDRVNACLDAVCDGLIIGVSVAHDTFSFVIPNIGKTFEAPCKARGIQYFTKQDVEAVLV